MTSRSNWAKDNRMFEGQPANRCRRIELLNDRHKRHPVPIEQLDELGEVHQRPAEPVHLVDNYGIDTALGDVGKELLQTRALQRAARVSAVVVGRLDHAPALAALTADERLA